MKKLVLKVMVAGVLAGSFAACVVCPAQEVVAAPASAASKETRLHFGVASVKQNKSQDKPKINIPPGPGGGDASTGGIFSASSMPLVIYMMFAYDLTGNQMQPLLRQLPDWATADVFDIEARTEDPHATKDQMRSMMQSLLAERFKMVVHKETQQVPALGLVVAKPGRLGARLQQHSTDVPCLPAPSNPPAGAPTQTTAAGGFPVSCGAIVGMPTSGLGLYAFGARDVSMHFIAGILGAMPELGRPVVDETGLTGTFDFKLEFTPQTNSAASSNVQTDPTGTTFFEAVAEQLGLKLVPEKRAVEVFVLDHVEYPSSN